MRVQVTEFKAVVSEMRPFPTAGNAEDSANDGRSGRSIWGASIDGRRVGIEWEWELRDDVRLVLSDPMAVDTNVLLLDANNRLLGELEAMIELGQAIRELPWVEHLLRRH